mmetsp:Transcript_609/g.649  ORF Transcript_609/g.649 Transcript_609/m.649 type:complete len:191 (+) Transcript_609:18-590(+)
MNNRLAREQLQQAEQKNLETLGNILRVAKETEEIGNATSKELYIQEQQIDRIGNKSNTISSNLDKSGKIVKSMGSFMGRVKGWFSKNSKEKEPEIQYPNNEIIPQQNNRNLRNQEPVLMAQPRKEMGYNEREDELLDEISQSVANTLISANAISDALDRQNKKLDVVHEITDRNNKKLQNLNEKTLMLLR